MVEDQEDLDGVDFDPAEIERRLHGVRRGGETVDPPRAVGCWHEDKHYPERSVILIGDARVRCMLGQWKPFTIDEAPRDVDE